MPDWTKPMSQTFEYWTVDPATWKDVKKLNCVKSSSISRDSESETLGSASFTVTEMIGECYIRTYLVTVQNGITEKTALGTHLVQTPSSKFNGRVSEMTLDGYTPLIELKEKQPDIGYFVPKDEPAFEHAYRIVREYARAPVTKGNSTAKLTQDFVADTGDTWLSFVTDLISNALVDDNNSKTGARITQYTLDLDELGGVLFSPVQDVESMQPRWTYTDDNSSILHPDVSMDHDLYDIPNVVEVIYSSSIANWRACVTIDDDLKNPDSPVSIKNRGRRIVHRVVNPSFPAHPADQAQIDEYAIQLLKALSTLLCTVSYTHGYCPARVNDCVRIDYARAGLNNAKAKIVSQNIKCVPGCLVTEKAVFAVKLWEG